MSLSVDSVDIKKKINNCKTLQEVEVIRLEYLGKKGLIPSEMKLLGNLPIDQKKIKGQELNKLKKFIEDAVNDHKIIIENKELEEKLKNESIDVTLPHDEKATGKIHPISQTIFSIIEIFGNLNYSVEAGPDIESDFNNFSALNIPPHHPAREMQDTFYVNNTNGEDNVLRTHTSPVQVRTMLKSKPPIKIIVPGRTYRSDSEPSAEMDVAYIKKNNALKIGEGEDWLEILGCGMVNPKVLENCNIDSKVYQGFAFGMGIERLSMLKYGITDMRGLFDLNIKWLDHYGFSPLDLKTRSEV